MGEEKEARRLVRLLLADPLKGKDEWEDGLEGFSEGDGRGLLIRCVGMPIEVPIELLRATSCEALRLIHAPSRYGDQTRTMSDTPLFPTLLIPSRVLQRHNIEILLTSLNVDVGPLNPTTSTFRPKDAILVPAIRTPTSATGRYTGITYPVHAALLLGDGIPSAVAYGRFTAAQPAHEFGSELVKLAVTAPAPESEPSQDSTQKYATVDLALAGTAIAKFRETVDNAVVYERGWFRSGMPGLADWLHARCVAEQERLKPAVQSLVSSFLADTAAAVAEAEAQLEAELQAARIPEETVSALFSALDVWAKNAHTELLEVLDTAFASAARRRCVRLLWEVGLRITYLLPKGCFPARPRQMQEPPS